MPLIRDQRTGRLLHAAQADPSLIRWQGGISGGGGGGPAPADAPYVTIGNVAALTAERALAVDAGELTAVDGGPNSSITLGLASTAVTPGSYGNATNVASFTVDGFGRLTAAANVPIAGVPASPHDLLSATHPDTVASTPPSPGDLLYGNPASLWDRFPLDGTNAENILGVAITLDNLEWKRLTTNHADTASWAAGPGAVQLVFGDVLTQFTDFGSSLGIVVKSSVLTTNFRTLQAPVAGLTIANPAGIAGDPTFALANDLAALEGLSGTGYARRMGVDTWTLDTTATPSAHMLLGVVHSDTTFAVPVRGDIVVANPTPTWDRLGIGTAGQILKVVGAFPNLDPDWVSGVPLVRVNDTNVTVTLTGSPTTALVTTTTMTLGWSGQLSIARGGTGAATALAAFNALSPLTTRGDLLTRDATDNIRLAIGTTGKYLRTDGTDPSWQALAYADLTGVPTAFPITVRKNTGADVGTRSRLNFIEGANITLTIADDGGSGEVDITIASSGGVTAHDLLSATHSDTLTAAVSRGSLIVGNATPLWSELVIGAAATFLKSDGTDAAWTAIAAADITAGTALVRVDDTNVTMALTGSPTVALLATTTMTLGWTGQLSIARGGTGQATALAAFNALSPLTTRGDLLTRDATNNVRLAVGASPRILQSDGTDPSWVALSADATLAAGGALTLATVNANVGTFGSATQVAQVTVNAKGLTTAVANVTVTPAASSITGGAALTKTDDTNVTLTLGGSPTTALLAATSLTLGWTGTLGLARGGTNANLSATGGTSQVLKQSSAGAAVTVGQLAFSDLSGTLSHAALSNLVAPADDHTQYLLLAGRAGGQVAIGGTGTGDDLELKATSNASPGDLTAKVILNAPTTTFGDGTRSMTAAELLIHRGTITLATGGSFWGVAMNGTLTLSGSPTIGPYQFFSAQSIKAGANSITLNPLAFTNDNIVSTNGFTGVLPTLGGFRDHPGFNLTGGGSYSASADYIGFDSLFTPATTLAFPTRTGFRARNEDGAGTVDTQVGVLIDDMTSNTTTTGIRVETTSGSAKRAVLVSGTAQSSLVGGLRVGDNTDRVNILDVIGDQLLTGTLFGGTASSDHLDLTANDETWAVGNTGRVKVGERTLWGDFDLAMSGAAESATWITMGAGRTYSMSGTAIGVSGMQFSPIMAYTAAPFLGLTPAILAAAPTFNLDYTGTWSPAQIFNNATTYKALTGRTVTFAGAAVASFIDNVTVTRAGTGDYDGAARYNGFGSVFSLAGGASFDTRVGFLVANASVAGGGTLDNQWGFYVNALTSAGTLNVAYGSAVTADATRYFLKDDGGAQSKFAGIVTTYNNLATAGNGLPMIAGVLNTAALSAAQTTAAFFTPPAAGFYQVSFAITLTRAAAGVGSSSILGAGVNLNYTTGDGATAKVQNVPMYIPGSTTATVDTGSATNTVGDTLIGSVVVYSSTTAMTYDVGYTSVGTTTMQYIVRARAVLL